MQNDLRRLSSILSNPILNTDSYKASHYLQYPPGTSAMFSYIESRGGRYDSTLFFGLQMLLKEYLSQPITTAMIDEARAFFGAHGEPFNEAGWRYIVEAYGGYLPVRVRAVPEGAVVPTHNVLVTVECDDPQVFWLTSYIETMLLRVWYPVTVATQSWQLRQLVRRYLEFRGFGVNHVMNITDVEDKIIKRVQQRQTTLREFTGKYEAEFLADFADEALLRRFAGVDAALRHLPPLANAIIILLFKAAADPDLAFRIDQHHAHAGAIFGDVRGLAHQVALPL